MIIIQGTELECVFTSPDGKLKLGTACDEYVISHNDLMDIIHSCVFEIDDQGKISPKLTFRNLSRGLNPQYLADEPDWDEEEYYEDEYASEPECEPVFIPQQPP